MHRLSSVSRLWWVWAISRVLMVAFTGITVMPRFIWDAAAADLTMYCGWAGQIVHEHAYPLNDVQWQYPPGAAALLIVPWLLGAGHAYTWFFFALVGAVDAGVLALLIRAARRDGRPVAWAGPQAWTAGVILLGRICYGRFDLIVAAIVLVALLWAVRRPAMAGMAVAVGVLLKLWPVVVLLGWRGRTLWRMSAGTVIGGAAVAAALTALGPGGWSFLRFQSKRGLQIESVAATPLLVARLATRGWKIAHRYGAEELTGPLVSVVARGCLVATVAGGVVLVYVWWRMRRPAPDLALAAVLLALATSRVLSPQYVVWAVAIAAVCALDPRTTQRPVVRLVLVLAFVTQLEFPFFYGMVATGSWPGVIVLLVRNGLLLYMTVLSLYRLCRNESEPGQEHTLMWPFEVEQPSVPVPDREISSTTSESWEVERAPS